MKYNVYIWSGSGYSLEPFEHIEAESEEEALDKAIVRAEKEAPSLLLDVEETELQGEKDGIYDPETGEGNALFNEAYLYVDATMEGAKCPYYVNAENLRICRE